MKLSLAKKIAAGFVTILVLLIVLAFAGRTGLIRVVDKVDSANRFQVLVDRILDARQNEKQFILTSDPKSVDIVNKDISALSEGANRIANENPDEDIKEQAREILKASDAYANAFQAYVSLAGNRDDLMSDMNLKASNALEITSRIRDEQREIYENLVAESETNISDMRSRVATAGYIKENFLQARGYHMAITASETDNISMVTQWKGHMDNIQRALEESAALMTEEISKKRHNKIKVTHAALVAAGDTFFADRQFENNQAVIKATKEMQRAVVEFQQEMQELLEFYVEDVQIFSAQAMELSSGADEIAKVLLNNRILEKEYIRNEDEGIFKQIIGNVGSIDTTISKIKEAIDDEEKTTPLNGIQEAVNNYISSFKSYADLMKKQLTAKETMEKNAAGIQSICLDSKETMRKQMRSQITNSTAFLTIVSVVAVILGLLIALYLARIIIKPLTRVVTALKDIAQGEGDLTQRIEINTSDEIGELAKWFNTFLSRLNNIVVDIGANSETVTASSGELRMAAEQMADGSRELSGRSNSVATAAEEMSSSMNSVAAASEEAATNLGMVADSAAQMKHTITEVAQNCDKARSVSEEATQKVKSASDRVGRLGESARDITQVTEVITDIAGQTNLLALNATIEAARAGEAGKGFAVVASEIKGLAAQTTDATLNIKEKIEGIQASTNDTVRDVEAITGVIEEVTDIVSAIAAAIEEQSVSATEVAENIEQASTGIVEVNENVAQSSQVSSEIASDISQVHQVSEEMTDQSDRMKQSAHDLSDLSSKLRDMIGVFKVSVEDSDLEIPERPRMDEIPDLMPWNDRFATGIQSIDDQHKELVRMVNHLHKAMKRKSGALESGKILQDLAAYTEFHFKHEEELFDAHDYPQSREHKQHHATLVEEVMKFKSEFDRGKAALSMDLMTFLTDWLKNHILKMDKAYGPYLKNRGVN